MGRSVIWLIILDFCSSGKFKKRELSKEGFKYEDTDLNVKELNKILIEKKAFVVNGKILPADAMLLVLVKGKEKVVDVAGVKKLIDEGSEVKTIDGIEVKVSESSEKPTAKVLKIDGGEVWYDIFSACENGLLVRMESAEAYAGRDLTVSFAKFVSETLAGILELEFDKQHLKHVQVSKKKYAGWKNEDKLLIKGLEAVRRDWSDMARELQMNAIMSIMHKPLPVARQEIEDMINRTIERFLKGDYTIDEVLLSSGIRDLSKYKTKDGKPPNLPQVRVAQQLINEGIIVSEGFKVEYVPFKVPADVVIDYVKGRIPFSALVSKKNSKTPLYERVVAKEIVEDKFDELKSVVDVEHILKNQILPPVERVVKAVWPDFEIKINDRNQTTLTKFFKQKPRKVESKTVKGVVI